MFKKLFILAAMYGIFISSSAASEIQTTTPQQGEKVMTETTVNDYEAVKKAINQYLEAGKKGKSEVMKSAFHKDAIMYTSANSEISGGAIQNLFDYIDSNPAAPEIEAQITAVDIAGTIAYARVESNNWHGARFSDMFLLLKEGNEWKIITKTYFTH